MRTWEVINNMERHQNRQENNIVEVQGLSRDFDGKTALAEVDFNVPEGCVMGLVGENGAGKTTLIKHLLGQYYAQKGTVRVFGLDPVKDPVGVLGKIGYLSENREMLDWMRLDELLDFTSAFYPQWDAKYAMQLVESFGLSLVGKVQDFSRGQRAQVGLILAVAHHPDLLLLDEPSSGLDPIVRRDILAEIIHTATQENRTVLFSKAKSSSVTEWMNSCNRITV
jgi:ABC-2 type transport system ATP-binding protein